MDLDHVRRQIRTLDSIPAVPSILRPLLAQLNRPPEQVQIGTLADLVACESSLTAKCLHLANSPLFGHARPITTIRAAVVALGIQRLQAMLLSACMVGLFRTRDGEVDTSVFWEHSFACALVSQQFARRIRHRDPEKAYLSGLLHDLGLIMSLVLFPAELQAVFALCKEESLPLAEAERAIFGFTHCDTGGVLAEEWNLPTDVGEVMRFHHACDFAAHCDLAAIVHLCDQLCQLGGLGHGLPLMLGVDLAGDQAWEAVMNHHPLLRQLDLARFTFELETYFVEAKRMVASLFRG
jgi:HD-like signal output (HDOD) protein